MAGGGCGTGLNYPIFVGVLDYSLVVKPDRGLPTVLHHSIVLVNGFLSFGMGGVRVKILADFLL